MYTTVYYLNYKNYYNRSAKSSEDILAYGDYITFVEDYKDFNPNDGIWAETIVNLDEDTNINSIDYVLVADADNSSVILSRWYVLEATRTRIAQYRLKLLRDVVADYKDIVINAPCFIEKATVNYGSPLLFNSEDMTFNQIKTREVKISDQMDCAWIVGYMNKDQGSTTITQTLDKNYVKEYNQIEDIPFYSRLTPNKVFNFLNVSSVSLSLRYVGGVGGRLNSWGVDFNQNGYIANYKIDDQYIPYLRTQGDYFYSPAKAHGEIARQCGGWYRGAQSAFLNAIYEQTALGTENEQLAFLNTYPEAGVIYKIGSKYYNIRRVSVGSSFLAIQPNAGGTLYGLFQGMIDGCNVLDFDVGDRNNAYRACKVNCYQNSYQLIVEEVPVPRDTYSFTIPSAENRTHLDDAPYDMFAIPYQPEGYRRYMTIPVGDGGAQIVINSDASMAIAQKITNQLTNQKVYDLQLLPYCPMQNILYERGINLYANTTLEKDIDFSIITDSNSNPQSVVLWCSSSEFSLIKDYNIPVLEPKVEAMCDVYRLVSPNYNGQFEFNHVMNEGVEFFQIDCTYKPYSPYIRVAPNFKGLYGGQYGDARGLICGGDFSLPTTTDQWKQYEINNKNYLNAFNRQIENMNVNNKYQRQSEVINAITGAFTTGASTGTAFGLTTANPVVGVISGIGATAASGIAGAIDVGINGKLRTEALDYTKDQFGYTLGNIRALPYTLNRVSSFNINNKIFPILEYYTCSDIEKQALRDKITYNGMTVMAIGTINDYIRDEETYIKGRIIRMNDLHEDYHVAVAIAEEIYKGVFI